MWQKAIEFLTYKANLMRTDSDFAARAVADARHWGEKFIREFQADIPEINPEEMTVWMNSSAGYATLSELAKACVQLTLEIPIGDPGHDLRHCAKDLATALRIMRMDGITDWRLLALFPALLHDIGRRAEAKPLSGINRGGDHAFIGAEWSDLLFRCFDLPEELIRHWDYAILRHQSGTPDGSDPWIAELVGSADRRQTLGAEKFMRALACDVGTNGVPLVCTYPDWSHSLPAIGSEEESFPTHLEFYLRCLYPCLGSGEILAEKGKVETIALLEIVLGGDEPYKAFWPECMGEVKTGRFKVPIVQRIFDDGEILAQQLGPYQIDRNVREMVCAIVSAKSATAPEPVIDRITEMIEALPTSAIRRWKLSIAAATELMQAHDVEDKALASQIMEETPTGSFVHTFASLVDELL